MVLSKVEVDLDKPVEDITKDEQRIINAVRGVEYGQVLVIKYAGKITYIKPTISVGLVGGYDG